MATAISDLLTRLNTRLRDAANTTWTAAEKTEALTIAINDPYVYGVTRDTSLTTSSSVYSYTLPSGVSMVYRLMVDLDGDGIASPVARTSWEVINGVLYLLDQSIPAGKTLTIIGKNKYTSSTSDYPTNVQEYILELAMVEAFELLKSSLTSRFLKNAITMADIVQSITTHKQRAAELRASITNQQLVDL